MAKEYLVDVRDLTFKEKEDVKNLLDISALIVKENFNENGIKSYLALYDYDFNFKDKINLPLKCYFDNITTWDKSDLDYCSDIIYYQRRRG